MQMELISENVKFMSVNPQILLDHTDFKNAYLKNITNHYYF